MNYYSRRNIVYKMFLMLLFIAITLNSWTAYADSFLFLKSAKACKEYLVSHQFHYRRGHCEYPVNADNGRGIDCSGFVGWAIYEYQGGNFECKPSKWYLATAKKLYKGEESDCPEYTKGWIAIQGSENFKPGDILCYSGHVHIFFGESDNEYKPYSVLNAGSDKALDSVVTEISKNYFQKAQYALRLP